MTTNPFAISPKDKKTRSRWLLIFISSYVIWVIILLSPILFLQSSSEELSTVSSYLTSSIVFVIYSLVSLWPLWDCGYRKPGTRLLTLYGLELFQRLLITFAATAALVLDLFNSENHFIKLILALILIKYVLDWYLCVLSFKLRRINKNRQKVQLDEFLYSHPQYQEKFEVLQHGKVIEEVAKNFTALIAVAPHCSRALSMLYKARRRELQKMAACAN
ncbi:MAG: hypothetical protein JSS61_05355 [Verrucomicrobia bacterium]|nr:hypothetical protein [Verrucomicrobiota bacterium]